MMPMVMLVMVLVAMLACVIVEGVPIVGVGRWLVVLFPIVLLEDFVDFALQMEGHDDSDGLVTTVRIITVQRSSICSMNHLQFIRRNTIL